MRKREIVQAEASRTAYEEGYQAGVNSMFEHWCNLRSQNAQCPGLRHYLRKSLSSLITCCKFSRSVCMASSTLSIDELRENCIKVMSRRARMGLRSLYRLCFFPLALPGHLPSFNGSYDILSSFTSSLNGFFNPFLLPWHFWCVIWLRFHSRSSKH